MCKLRTAFPPWGPPACAQSVLVFLVASSSHGNHASLQGICWSWGVESREDLFVLDGGGPCPLPGQPASQSWRWMGTERPWVSKGRAAHLPPPPLLPPSLQSPPTPRAVGPAGGRVAPAGMSRMSPGAAAGIRPPSGGQAACERTQGCWDPESRGMGRCLQLLSGFSQTSRTFSGPRAALRRVDVWHQEPAFSSLSLRVRNCYPLNCFRPFSKREQKPVLASLKKHLCS